MEARIVQARGIKFAAIKAGKFRRNHFDSRLAQVLNPATIVPNTRDAFRVVQGLGQSLALLRRWKPAVVFCKGGYVAFPVGIAASMLRIPLVIHESDITPGFGTKLLAGRAAKIAVGFPARLYKELDASKLVFTGNPVRREVLEAKRPDGLEQFGLDGKLPVLLVMGGSQGAAEINDTLAAALPELVKFCQVLHVTGENEYERVKFAVSRLGKLEHAERYQAFGYLSKELAPALAAADVVVSRAGANSIAELAVLKKPTVLIPNTAMAGHQLMNAQVLARAGAVRVLSGDKVTADRLVGEVRRLTDDPNEARALGEHLAAFGRGEAARELAELILAAAGAEEGSE
jgi:UDP-N-acetylglucosamine--N-acetylmuramyl-(pentapeptide) pyrophosphoryl-undecaprenol N-acetylglucosamine transferase